tara:strand:- start:692 stop:1288 length:597 start_codon:yes stop_codon:yes gene_type:complete
MKKKRTLTIPPSVRHEISEWCYGGFLLFYFNEASKQPEVVADFEDSSAAFSLQSFIETWLYAVKLEKIKSLEQEEEDDLSNAGKIIASELDESNPIDDPITNNNQELSSIIEDGQGNTEIPDQLVEKINLLTKSRFILFHFDSTEIPCIKFNFSSNKDALALQEFVKCWHSAFFENSVGLMLNNYFDDDGDEESEDEL